VQNAVFYVHQKEMDRIHDPHPLDFRYLEDYFEDVEANGQVVALSGDAEIVPGLRLIHTPAHTPGGMSVAVDTPAGTGASSPAFASSRKTSTRLRPCVAWRWRSSRRERW
jgi:N-acyl homoserine lactone hydrolase